jgi:hypothetical protein
MRCNAFFVSFLLLAVLWMQCALPQDPETDPKNAFPLVKKVDDLNYAINDTVKVYANYPTKFDFTIVHPELIDSILIQVIGDNNTIETSVVCRHPFVVTLSQWVTFPQIGQKGVLIRSYNNGGIIIDKSIICKVLTEPDVVILKVNGLPKTEGITVNAKANFDMELLLESSEVIDSIQLVTQRGLILTSVIPTKFAKNSIIKTSLPDTGSYKIKALAYCKTINKSDTVWINANASIIPVEPKITINKFNGMLRADTMNVFQITDTDMELQIESSEFIDSIKMLIQRDMVIQKTIFLNVSKSVIVKVSFPDTGNYTVKTVAYSKSNVKNDSIVIKSLRAPLTSLWKDRSVNQVSIKGSNDTLRLNTLTRTDIQSPVTFQVVSSAHSALFLFKDSLLISNISTDTGHYMIKCIASTKTLSDTLNVNWIVIGIPLKVVAKNDTAIVNENSQSLIDVLKNDEVSPGVKIITNVNGAKKGKAEIVDSKIMYTPAPFSFGFDTLTYVLNKMDSARVFITVNAAMYTLKSDSVVLEENSSVSVNVLKNDIVSSGILKVTGVSTLTLGKVQFADSLITIVNDNGKTGTDSIIYYVNNKRDSSVIHIKICNAAVFIRNDSATVLQDEARVINVLKNDSISSGKLKLARVSNGKIGTSTVSDSSIIYRPASGKFGKDTIAYYVADRPDSGLVFITIEPIIIKTFTDTASINEDGGSITIDVTKNDSISTGTVLLTSVNQGKIGKTSIYLGKVVYTPNINKFGKDTIEYLVNNAKTGTIIVEVLPVNDKTIFVSFPDSIIVAEAATRVVAYKATDSDIAHVKFKINKTLPWMVVRESLDSLILTFHPLKNVAAPQVPFKDTLKIFAIDSTFNDTTKLQLIITVTNTNSIPVFLSTDTSVVINEGVSRTIKYPVFDADGDIATISVVRKPSWVNVVGIYDTARVTINPPADVASNTNPITTDYLQLKVNDGTVDGIINVKIQVQNVNRKPGFTGLSSTSRRVNLGDSLLFNFAGSDPDGDNVTFSLASPVANVSVDGSGKFKFLCDRTKYSISSSILATARISDGVNYSDTTITIAVDPHIWKFQAGSFHDLSKVLFAASGSDTVYYATNDGSQLLIKRSIDGAQSWQSNVFATGRDGAKEKPNILIAKGAYLILSSSWATGPVSDLGTCYYFANGSSDRNILTTPGRGIALDISASGRVVYNAAQYMSGVYLYYMNDINGTLNNPIAPQYDCFSVSDNHVWALKDTVIYHMNTFSPNYPFGFNSVAVNSYSQTSKIEDDANNGDTIYLYENAPTNMVTRVIAGQFTPDRIFLDPGIGVIGMKMITGSIGWLIASNGKVYFTQDGFVHRTEEQLAPSGAAITIVKIVRSADNKTMYLIGKDPGNYYYVYKY